MEITITKTEKQTKQITLPMYVETNDGNVKWALLSETKCTSVSNWGTASGRGVDTSRQPLSAFRDDWKEITSKQFADFYKQTATEIWEQCESFLYSLDEKRTDASDPAQDEMDYQRTRQTV